MEHFLQNVEVVYTNPTPHGGEAMFQYHNRLYMLRLVWGNGEVETTLASQVERDPIVLTEKYQNWFLIALKRFLVEHTNGELTYYIKEPKDIFVQGIKPVKVFGKYDGNIDVVYEFGGLFYAIRNVFCIKNKNGSWVENIDESDVVHFHLPMEESGEVKKVEIDCQCGKKYQKEGLSLCEYMDTLIDWAWEGVLKHADFEILHKEYLERRERNKKIVSLNSDYYPFGKYSSM